VTHCCFDTTKRPASKTDLDPIEFANTKDALIDMAESAQSEEGKRILLVEDEAFVREPASQALQANGYSVVSAGNAIEALNLCVNAACAIDLLLVDIVMPDMTGVELAERFRRLHTQGRVLFMSGYAAEFSPWASSPANERQLRKPFTVDVLLAMVRSALNPIPISSPVEAELPIANRA
jgi:two-component system, cell cycle sensor histidine kinase and response regulator CckA